MKMRQKTITDNKNDTRPYQIGKAYAIRTIMFANVGKLKDVIVNDFGRYLVLTNASWIADTGSWAECLRTGSFKEVEPFKDDVFINVDAIIDGTPYYQALPVYKLKDES